MRTTLEHDRGDGTAVIAVTLSIPDDTLPKPTGGRDDALATERQRDLLSEVLINATTRAALAAFELDELSKVFENVDVVSDAHAGGEGR